MVDKFYPGYRASNKEIFGAGGSKKLACKDIVDGDIFTIRVSIEKGKTVVKFFINDDMIGK